MQDSPGTQHLKSALQSQVFAWPLKQETIVAADGPPAFNSAAWKMEKVHLKGVSRLTKIFAPTVKLWKGSLPSTRLKAFQSHTKRRHGLVKDSKHCFFVAGGDNEAEGPYGAIKGNLRRMINVGRFVASSRKKSAASMSWTLFSAHSSERISCRLFQRNMCCEPFQRFSA